MYYHRICPEIRRESFDGIARETSPGICFKIPNEISSHFSAIPSEVPTKFHGISQGILSGIVPGITPRLPLAFSLGFPPGISPCISHDICSRALPENTDNNYTGIPAQSLLQVFHISLGAELIHESPQGLSQRFCPGYLQCFFLIFLERFFSEFLRYLFQDLPLYSSRDYFFFEFF